MSNGGQATRAVRVRIDHHKCVGSTMCIQVAPEAFALNDAGQSVVADLEACDAQRILDAAAECPLEAITVEDAVTGERLFP